MATNPVVWFEIYMTCKYSLHRRSERRLALLAANGGVACCGNRALMTAGGQLLRLRVEGELNG